MTKQEFKYYTNVFYHAFFKVADWKKEHPENGQYYLVPIHAPSLSGIRNVPNGNDRFWIRSRNSPDTADWYDLLDFYSNKAIRRVYTSTKGCIQSLLKSFLDTIEDELDGEGI